MNTPGVTVQTGLVLGFLYLFITLIRFSLKSLRPKHFPPGPAALPFIGNLHHFASSKPFLQYTNLQKQYGDIIGLKAGPTNIAILNTPQLVRELLEKRGATYSDRPNDYIPRELIVCGAQHILFLPHDGYLRQWRTAVRHLLGPNGVEQIFPILDAASAYIMHGLLSSPEQFIEHFRVWSLMTPLITICGQKGAQDDPALIKRFYDNQDNWLELLTPGLAPPVDLFPILKFLPEFLAGWKRKARILQQTQRGFYEMMLASAKKDHAKRSRDPQLKDYESLMAKLLRDREVSKGGFDDHQLAYLGGGLLDAAVDTTFSSVVSLVKVFAAYPEVLKKAQEEVDAVCGSERPPEAQVAAKLQYLKACFIENLRWRPPAPTNLPHVLTTDDTVGGYHLPKGTVMLQNTWLLSHDPDVFDAPEKFDPDRYLRSPWGTKLGTDDAANESRKQTYGFGSGRRQCPGDIFAQNSVLIALAKLVWCFDVVADRPVDVSLETGYHGGLVMGPEAFEVRFVPRSEGRRRVVLEDYEARRHVIE